MVRTLLEMATHYIILLLSKLPIIFNYFQSSFLYIALTSIVNFPITLQALEIQMRQGMHMPDNCIHNPFYHI